MSDEGLSDGDRAHSTSLYPPACHTSESLPTFYLKKKNPLILFVVVQITVIELPFPLVFSFFFGCNEWHARS